MRILVLTNQYPPHSIGGYALSCQSIVEHFKARGHNVYVLTSDANLPGVAPDRDGPSQGVHRDLYLWFRDLGRKEPTVPRPRIHERFRYERQNQKIMRQTLQAWTPNVVSVWEMGAMSLSTLALVERAGVPLVLNLHDYWPQYAPEWDPWLRSFERRPLGRLVLGALGIVTTGPTLLEAHPNVISRSLLERLSQDCRWSFSNARIVPFGVDPRLFPIVRPETREWRWRILYVGRLEWLKGLRTLALAMRHLPAEASLEVIGKGDPDLPGKMREIIGDPAAAERIRFSSCPRSELAQRYEGADVVVFPSEWDEPFGLVPLEAMACGTPVVATGTGGSGEYLRDGKNCLLFPPGDPVLLASAIERLAVDPGLRARIIDGGSQTAGSYSLERTVDELESLHLAAGGFRSESPR